MKLSLCLAVFNEEKFIQYPLDSAYDLVDEVIIVDGGSEDKTVEIAKKYGKKIKVIETTNPPMFHINKQKALDAARGDWILQLDADEALSEELKEEIRSVILNDSLSSPTGSGIQKTRVDSRLRGNDSGESQNDNDQVVAYNLPRKNFFLSKFLEKGGQYPDYTVRLYKRGVAKFPCKSVHENVEIIVPSERDFSPTERDRNDKERSSRKAGNLSSRALARDLFTRDYIGYLKSPLLHYADPDFSRYLHRWNRYTSLDADLIVKKKEHVKFISYFFLKPLAWFLKTYVRHKGFQDGFPGFVFSLFSSIRFWVIYIKVWQARWDSQKIKSL